MHTLPRHGRSSRGIPPHPLDVRPLLRGLPGAAIPRRAPVEETTARSGGEPRQAVDRLLQPPLLVGPPGLHATGDTPVSRAAPFWPDRRRLPPDVPLLREAGLLQRRARHGPGGATVPRGLPGDPVAAGHRPLDRRRRAVHRPPRPPGQAALEDRPPRLARAQRRAPPPGPGVPLLGGEE